MQMLRDRIVSGEIQAGTKLPSERSLSSALGVSRPVIREVLKVLAEQKLIETLPGRGAYVRAVSYGDAATAMEMVLHRAQATPRHLIEARMMLECEAAPRAALRAEALDLRLMEQALLGCEASSNILEKTRYDIAFHTAVVRAARNPVIEIMYSSISALAIEMMLRSLGDPVVIRDGLPYHRRVFDAIRAHSPEMARAEMASHLEVAMRCYGEDLDRNLNSIAHREVARLLGPGTTLGDFLAMTNLSQDDEHNVEMADAAWTKTGG